MPRNERTPTPQEIGRIIAARAKNQTGADIAYHLLHNTGATLEDVVTAFRDAGYDVKVASPQLRYNQASITVSDTAGGKITKQTDRVFWNRDTKAHADRRHQQIQDELNNR